jgi:hypothetical protein
VDGSQERVLPPTPQQVVHAVTFLAGAKPEEAADGQGEAKLDHLLDQVEHG